jgi:thiol-disulfide isomerase/thioredoxin
MTTASRFVLFGLLIAVATACGGKPEPEKTTAKSDYPAPVMKAIETASFVDFNGNPVPLEQFKGKVVIMDFWETWCGPCVRSFPTLDRLVKEYPNDFAVLAITPGFNDGPEEVKAFMAQNPYPFTFVMDAGLSRQLNIEGIPFKVFIAADGTYIQTVMGAYPNDYDKIKAIIEKNRRS